MAKKYDLTNKVVGKLTVLSLVPVNERPNQNHGNYWLCKCECGNYTKVPTSYLTGNTNLLELSKYSFSGNNIYNIGINTSVSTFLNSVVNKDELNLKFYSVLGAEIKNSNVITTGSYVDVSVNNQNQRYYLIVDGDVNSDGKLSIFDIVKINNHIVYSDKKLSGIYYLAADYNMDDKVSIFDIV